MRCSSLVAEHQTCSAVEPYTGNAASLACVDAPVEKPSFHNWKRCRELHGGLPLVCCISVLFTRTSPLAVRSHTLAPYLIEAPLPGSSPFTHHKFENLASHYHGSWMW